MRGLVITLLLVGYVASQECDSDNGWHEHNGKCLRVSRSAPETQFTWQEARAQCMMEGGDLASIHSQEEQDFITQLANSIGLSGSYLWIGMAQMDSKTGSFSWSDGTATDYTDWSPSEPRMAGVTNCAYTLTEESQTGPMVRHDYTTTTYGILDPNMGHLPHQADGVDTFYFGGGSQYDQNWCEYMCSMNEGCAGYSWYQHYYNAYWQYVCVGRSDRYDILQYEDYASSGVRTLGSPSGWWLTGNCGLNHAFACKKDIGSDSPVTIPPTSPIESYCPDGYFSADGHTGNKCYRIYTVESESQGLRWEQALLFCRNGPGVNPDLASIHSREDNAIITARIQEYTLGFWIGVHYAESHDRWVWADNTEPIYSNWAPGRPAQSGQCGELWSVAGPPGTWSDLACDVGRGFICQTYKDADNIIATPPPTEPTTCPEGWFPYWYSCYKLDPELRTWQAARDNCESLTQNATLVSIHAEAENSAVFLGAGVEDNYPVWIGLYKENPEDDVYKWTDCWPNYYANFDTDGTRGDGCVTMKNNALWNDTSCSNTYASICKTTNVSAPEQPPPGEGSCPSGNWIMRGGRCYYFSVDTDTYINALTRCQYLAGSSSASLVSIENYAENDFIYSHLKGNPYSYYAWIGLRFDSTRSQFIWLDGTDSSYRNWAPGQPNSPFNEPCGEMDLYYSYGMWNDVSCDSYDYNNFVCETALGPAVTYPPVPTSAPGECPSVEWVKRETDCFLVRPMPMQKLHWHAALDMCKTLTGARGSLATIRSQEENQFVYYWADYLTPDYETPSCWIGMYKQGLGYPYIWEDGTTVEYTNWAPGEPNDIDGTQNCIRMYTTHTDPYYVARWDDFYCSAYDSLGYVCRALQGNYDHLDHDAIEKQAQMILDGAKRLQEKIKTKPELLEKQHNNMKIPPREPLDGIKKSPPFDASLWKNKLAQYGPHKVEKQVDPVDGFGNVHVDKPSNNKNHGFEERLRYGNFLKKNYDDENKKILNRLLVAIEQQEQIPEVNRYAENSDSSEYSHTVGAVISAVGGIAVLLAVVGVIVHKIRKKKTNIKSEIWSVDASSTYVTTEAETTNI